MRAWALLLGGVLSLAAAQGSPSMIPPTFVVDPSWPKPLPNHWLVGAVVGVAVDRHDHIWITHRPSTLQPNETRSIWKAAPPVLEFDQDGTLLSSWGGPGAGYEWPQLEHGIHVDDQDNVWLGAGGDKDAHILKFTRQGKFLMQIGHQGKGQGSNDTQNLGAAAHMIVDRAANELYVAVRLRQPSHRRLRRDDRRLQAALGRLRKAPGRRLLHERRRGAAGSVQRQGAEREQAEPVRSERSAAAAVPHRTRGPHLERRAGLRLADRTNDRLQVFKKDGTFVQEAFIAKETFGSGSVWDIGFSTDPEQTFAIVIDGTNQQVYVLRRNTLEVLSTFGAPATGPASSTARTTSPSTRRATSTSPRPTKENVSSGSHGHDSAAHRQPLLPGSGPAPPISTSAVSRSAISRASPSLPRMSTPTSRSIRPSGR